MKMWRCYKVVDAIFRYSQSRMQSRGKLREGKNYRIAVYSLISEKGIKQVAKALFYAIFALTLQENLSQQYETNKNSSFNQ